nr:hypothetical protein [Nocardiopsis sp. 90127]
MNTDIEDFLIEPLTEHPGGVRAGVEDAAAAITARVESWTAGVAG